MLDPFSTHSAAPYCLETANLLPCFVQSTVQAEGYGEHCMLDMLIFSEPFLPLPFWLFARLSHFVVISIVL